ncbi:MAG: ATP-dependent Clp protease ATP-binding subunit ClpC, partial [bacterium]
SNVGTHETVATRELGLRAEKKEEDPEKIYSRMKSKVMEEVKKLFRPELLNRIDEVLVFKPLGINELKGIVDILLKPLNKELESRNIKLKIEDQVKELIVKNGYNPSFGARPLRRTITSLLEETLAEEMLKNSVFENCVIEAYAENDNIKYKFIKEDSVKLDVVEVNND